MVFKILGPNDKILSVVTEKKNPLREGRPPGEIIPLEKDEQSGVVIAGNVYFAFQDLRSTYLTLKDFLKDMARQFHAVPSVFEFYIECLSEGMEHQAIIDLFVPAMREVYGDSMADQAEAAINKYQPDLESTYQKLLKELAPPEEETVDTTPKIIV